MNAVEEVGSIGQLTLGGLRRRDRLGGKQRQCTRQSRRGALGGTQRWQGGGGGEREG